MPMIHPSDLPAILAASEELADVEPVKMCGWCHRPYRGDHMMPDGTAVLTIDGFISHGICKPCHDGIKADLSRLNTERLNLKAL